MFRQRVLMSAVAAIAMTLAHTASATPVFYISEAAFDTAIAGIAMSLQDFESSTPTGFQTGDIDTGMGIIVSQTMGNDIVLRDPFQQGTKGVGWVANDTSGLLTFIFAAPINAFGIDIFDFGDLGTSSLTLTTATGSEVIFPFFYGPDENQLFGGVVDTMAQFVSASFSLTTGDYVEFDNLEFGASEVPEPTSMALFGLTPLGMGFAARRRRRKGNPIAADSPA